MKSYNKDGRTIVYGFADPQAAQQRRRLKASVVEDKKKKSSKYGCRNRGKSLDD